ncbi:Protein of unknown function [Blastococcus aggregatus]|uniref:DUF3068 domain-containing protein n=1 Tax=Blastococcus aggregatus TaxID=38502 RepID=A0A285V612_9ACTN|nr:porin PorA family protein [Blastococcus aggregatus]SOC49564.1 Protein of unknown function [Blastococcus aggregatus]
MRLTRSSVVLAVVGVLLLAVAAVVRFVVVPAVSKLPADTDILQEFEGTYTGLDPAALSGGSEDVLLEDAPVEASRRIDVESVDGDTAIVVRTVERSIDGVADPSRSLRYAIDRTTEESTTPPEGAGDVVDSEGLVFTLPINPSTDEDYRLWDQNTAEAYPLTYQGEDSLEGRTVYLYGSTMEGTVADPESLGLPTSVSKEQLIALAPALLDLLPPDLAGQLPAVVPLLPDTIPLSYTSVYDVTISADAELGATIAGTSNQVITAQLPLGPQTVEVPFSTVELSSTDASIADRAADTADSATQLNLIRTVLPIVAVALGLLLLVAALLLARRAGRRPQQATSDTSASQRSPQSV